MHYRSMFPDDLFAQLDRFQRDLQQAFDMESSIRGFARGGFPALNVGTTQKSIEMYVFAPGLEPGTIDVQLEQGVLTIAGQRTDDLHSQAQRATVQINERFAGSFRRVLTLPDEVDAESVSAHYRDGVLHISVARRESVQPRRISVH
ncbi:Hsp20/alpha crystallin family protein [Massilia sp. CF038]|uniref:Hsp20/alpha crystallin family protein n=1 Tax=Massilia sp. CF038 TaxID=1881045 RepID=UPI000914A33E|nr:Hsp20/alpha crystallin family protein [Massilia sp. CF038]SHH21069.1 HSP20 family protein [Massilia sp. CF038]